MKVFYCVRDLSQVHSCIYNMYLIRQVGYEVVPILGATTEELNGILARNSIQTEYFSLSKKMSHWKYFLRLNRCFFKNMKEGLKTYRKGDLVIIGTADSALFAYPLYIKKRFVICLLEMHENQSKLQNFLRHVCNKADSVICCEMNRARYAQFSWGLKQRPFVISNKPYGFSQVSEQISEHSTHALSQINGKRTILYQAWHIHQTDVISNLLRALALLNEEIVLVIMGIVDSCVDKSALSSIYPNIIWAGHIPAPKHLEVTRSIDIGVAMYSETSLNNMFCAPNKTFEYTSFGKPVLCNDIPGLVETIGLNDAGTCVNWNSPQDIASGISLILSNYDEYSKNAKSFYEREDNVEKMRIILSSLSE